MKHQITIIGGQTVPVFWGIKVHNPNVVHLLCTQDSKDNNSVFEELFPDIQFYSYQVSPFDFSEIENQVKHIIENNPNTEFELNLTGGTKVMALACYNVFKSHNYNAFYIDQKNRLFDFKTKNYTTIDTKISIETFLKLSGHSNYRSNLLSDYTSEELIFANTIKSFASNRLFNHILKVVQRNCNNIGSCQELLYVDNRFRLNWISPDFSLEYGGNIITSTSTRAFEIAFKGAWWELLVANSLKNWNNTYELGINVELFSRINDTDIKNEIDVIINTGHQLIFIECKSGNVKQEDINKIRTVKKIYGGISSKSVLVSKYRPRPVIMEKCKDLGIGVFSERNLFLLKDKLGQLITKMEL